MVFHFCLLVKLQHGKSCLTQGVALYLRESTKQSLYSSFLIVDHHAEFVPPTSIFTFVFFISLIVFLLSSSPILEARLTSQARPPALSPSFTHMCLPVRNRRSRSSAAPSPTAHPENLILRSGFTFSSAALSLLSCNSALEQEIISFFFLL